MNNHSYRNILFGLGIAALAASCGTQGKDADADKVREMNERTEKSAGQFDPAFASNPQNSHLAVRVGFDNGVLQAAPYYSVRPGKLPHPSQPSGDFSVELKDAAGKAIGKYYMQNPMTLRVCDGEPNPDGLKPVGKGSFDLLLPNDKTITGVTFSSGDKPVGRIDLVFDRMKEVPADVPTQPGTPTDTNQAPPPIR